MDLAVKPDTDISKPEEPAASNTPSEETQETISLDTDDKRYVTYAQAIKEKIAGQWKYPQEARKKKLEGRLVALFSSQQGRASDAPGHYRNFRSRGARPRG